MSAPKKNTPAAKGNTEVAVPMVDMTADAGAGFEGATKDSFSIPFLAILQSGSPQCKKSDGAYIKGAEEGMLMNTATSEVYSGDEGVFFLPCAYTMSYVEWQTRENGGGFRGEHDSNKGAALMRTCTVDDKNRHILPNQNQLNQTHNFYGLLLDEEGGYTRAVISMTSTQIKVAKKWMTTMNMQFVESADGKRLPAPMFANIYHMTTVAQSNDKGSWFVYNPTKERAIDPADAVDVDRYLAARAFKDSILKGEVKTAERSAEPSAEVPSDSDEF